jgi:lipid-A-disaccharide synthase-like uncharacterized protein
VHEKCLLIRKLYNLIGLAVGIIIFVASVFTIQLVFPSYNSLYEWPIFIWAIAIIVSVIPALYFIFRIHFQNINKIYQYYVRHSVVPESDKSWRRKIGKA